MRRNQKYSEFICEGGIMRAIYIIVSALFGITLIFCFINVIFLFEGEVYAATAGDFTTPATATRVSEDMLTSLIDYRADGKTPITENIGGVQKTYTPVKETYLPQDRQWQGTPSIACLGRRIWCAWQTGGNSEPRIFNYIVVAYSDDNGKTWIDPFMIIDHPAEDQGVYVTCPSFWKNSKGNLCINFVQYGTWTVEIYDADAKDINDVTWSEPYKMSNSRVPKAPTKIVDEFGKNWLMYASESEAGDAHPAVTRIYASEDDGKTWKLRSVIPSLHATQRTCAESNLVQTRDGTLIVASRIEDGYANGMEVSYSYDYGFTWTEYKSNLEEPFIGPGSKFHLELLPSGNLLMVNHATTSARENLKIYLSEDNGNTWPYKMILDSRADVTYPYVFSNGDKIYITWDKGRYIEKEIRVSILTEEDIKAGNIISQGSVTMLKASKLNSNYKEIIALKTEFERDMTFTVGTDSTKIREKLPTSIIVIDDSGAEHTLLGLWKCKGYNANYRGPQIFTFEAEMPLNVADNYNLLSVEVTLVEKKSSGCGANFNNQICCVSLPAAITALGLFIFKNKRGKE